MNCRIIRPISRGIISSLLVLSVLAAELSLPEKMIDLKNGEIFRDGLLTVPHLVIVANRKAFEVIEESAAAADYPDPTIWVPNISAAPGWIIRAFIKPALVKTAKKVSPRIMYDPDGDWARGLNIFSDNNDYVSFFYAYDDKVIKIMDDSISKKSYKKEDDQRALVKRINNIWNKFLNDNHQSTN